MKERERAFVPSHAGQSSSGAPECRTGLGQKVSSADEVGMALVIAGDTSKPLSGAVAPIVLTTGGTCSGGASRTDSNWQNTVSRSRDSIRCLTCR